jgi:hypothetical protein
MPQSRKPFKIEVTETDNSLAYSHKVILTDSIAQVLFIGGLIGEEQKEIWFGKPKTVVLDSIYFILDSGALDSLKDNYADSLVSDGLQLSYRIDYKGKSKNIHLNNYSLPQLHQLTQFVNSTLPDSLFLNAP